MVTNLTHLCMQTNTYEVCVCVCVYVDVNILNESTISKLGHISITFKVE